MAPWIWQQSKAACQRHAPRAEAVSITQRGGSQHHQRGGSQHHESGGSQHHQSGGSQHHPEWIKSVSPEWRQSTSPRMETVSITQSGDSQHLLLLRRTGFDSSTMWLGHCISLSPALNHMILHLFTNLLFLSSLCKATPLNWAWYHALNPSTWEVEIVGSLRVQGHPSLYSKLLDSQGYVDRPCLKNQ